jgi:hypothetical protein
MSVTATLRQEKITLSDLFVAVSRITAANPAGYYPVFVVSENIGDPTNERFDRVASLNDLATYSENPLRKIMAGTPGDFSGLGATAGDLLEITNAPDHWLDSFLTAAKFVIATVDPDYLILQTTEDFPTTLDNATWTLRNAAETVVRGSGTGAKCVRETTTGATTYLRRHLTQIFEEVKAAADHVKSVSAFVEALIDDANEDVDQFSGVQTESFS